MTNILGTASLWSKQSCDWTPEVSSTSTSLTNLIVNSIKTVLKKPSSDIFSSVQRYIEEPVSIWGWSIKEHQGTLISPHENLLCFSMGIVATNIQIQINFSCWTICPSACFLYYCCHCPYIIPVTCWWCIRQPISTQELPCQLSCQLSSLSNISPSNSSLWPKPLLLLLWVSHSLSSSSHKPYINSSSSILFSQCNLPNFPNTSPFCTFKQQHFHTAFPLGFQSGLKRKSNN